MLPKVSFHNSKGLPNRNLRCITESVPSINAEQQAEQPARKGLRLPGFLRPKQKEPEPPAPEVKWGLLDWGAYNQPWQVC